VNTVSTSERTGEIASGRRTALLEAAMTLPLLLLVSVSIFEFGRGYQTWQVLTNAAREGARVAVLPNQTAAVVEARVRQYMAAGQLPDGAGATVIVNSAVAVSLGTGTAKTSLVTVNYPFNFMVLQPVARLLVSGSTLGAPITISASAQMRNESQ
jgi:Flp pilus assembly protein TadG